MRASAFYITGRPFFSRIIVRLRTFNIDSLFGGEILFSLHSGIAAWTYKKRHFFYEELNLLTLLATDLRSMLFKLRIFEYRY